MRVFTLIVAILLTTILNRALYAQCEGPANNGAVIIFSTPEPGGSSSEFSTTVGECMLVFNWDPATDNVTVEGMNGLMIAFTTAGYAANIPLGTDISMLPNFSSGPLIMYNTVGHYGEFGGGVSGFLALHKNGMYGWAEVMMCGVKECSPEQYEFTIVEKGLSEAPKDDVISGQCPTLLIDPIPTLSQWSLIILAVLLLIFGTVAVREHGLVYKSN